MQIEVISNLNSNYIFFVIIILQLRQAKILNGFNFPEKCNFECFNSTMLL